MRDPGKPQISQVPAALPGTPELRRKQIELQVALLNPIGHVKGFAAPETKAAVQRARVLIEQAEALGEPPARLFSVLFGLWVTNLAAFNGDALRELAAQFLALSERQGAAIQLMIGHRLMGTSLLHAGDFAQCRSHFDRAITLYDPATHRPLAARFGQDSGVAILCYRSWAQWILGYPEASLADADRALRYAQEIDHAPTLMFALTHLSITYILCRKDEAATASLNQIVALADEKGALFWKNGSIMLQGCVLSLNGEAAAAVKMITSVIAAARSTGATMWLPLYLLHLGNAYGHLGEYDEAWGFIGEAMTTIEATKERWWESELNRTAGELALKSRGANAEEYFDRALVIARQQQAKSWELRVAMSMARLWRDQGKRAEARELLASVYGWFTEGFDTRDLKEAKALLEELA
jgi:predicted ATPase